MNSHERAAERTCTSCGETKAVDCFSGRQSWCKACINEYSKRRYLEKRSSILKDKKRYREANKPAIAERQKKYYQENAERLAAYMAEYRAANRDVLLQKKREDYRKNRERYLQRKSSPEYNQQLIRKRRERRQSDPTEMAKHNFSRALRRKAEKQATPSWCNLAEVRGFYEEAQRLTVETGVKHSVDHIYPLQGKTVCGLHVPENLRVIPLAENCSKQNKVLSDEIV